MIRIRVKGWDTLKHVCWVVLYAVAIIWGALAWLLMLPYDHGGTYTSPPTSTNLVSWQLGLVIWLGPFVIYGLGWVIRNTFEISLVNPAKEIRRRLEK